MASPTFQGALKYGFGEAVVACDTTESCKLPSFDSCRKGSFVPTKKLILLRTQPIGLVLQLALCSKRRCGEVFLGTWFRKPGSFFQSQQAGSMFHSQREHPAYIVGSVARLCCRWLSPGKATRISNGSNLNGIIHLKKKERTKAPQTVRERLRQQGQWLMDCQTGQACGS